MDETKIQFYAKTSSNAYWRYFKGQIISKANFLVLIGTKKHTKLFFDFCPKDLKWVK